MNESDHSKKAEGNGIVSTNLLKMFSNETIIGTEGLKKISFLATKGSFG